MTDSKYCVECAVHIDWHGDGAQYDRALIVVCNRPRADVITIPDIPRGRIMTWAEWVEECLDPGPVQVEPKHSDYPHWPGALVGCPACETTCFCNELNEGQLSGYVTTCVHCGGE